MKAERSMFRWHNKNKSGGNFGINILGVDGKNYQISADYAFGGDFFNIRFGYIYQAGMRIALGKVETLEELCIRLMKIIELTKQENKRFHEMQEKAV